MSTPYQPVGNEISNFKAQVYHCGLEIPYEATRARMREEIISKVGSADLSSDIGMAEEIRRLRGEPHPEYC